MKAVICTKYGKPSVLEMREVETPTPKDDEILIRIKATAVNSGDCRIRRADPFAVRLIFGFTKPRKSILGCVYSGEIEKIGKNITSFKVGDLVFGHTDMNFGAYASFICVNEGSTVFHKPTHFSHREAASVPFWGLTALHFIKKADIKKEDKVLIIGASGAVGSAAVQISKALGAKVTAVVSSGNMDLLKNLKADQCIDYQKEKYINQLESYDVVFDAVNVLSIQEGLDLTKSKGKFISSAADMQKIFVASFNNNKKGKKIITGVVSHSKENLKELVVLIEKNEFAAVIDRIYPLTEIDKAHHYVDLGHKKGSVVIEV